MSRALYIVNPVAGGGRGRRVAAAVEAVLREVDAGAELVFTPGPGGAEPLELPRHANQELVLDLDGQVLRRRALLVAVGNGRYYAGGMLICPRASAHDGLLDVCLVGDVPRLEVLRLLPTVFSGRHVEHPKVE